MTAHTADRPSKMTTHVDTGQHRRLTRMARSRPAPRPITLTRDALRRIDAACAARFGLPTLCLMEQAGAAVARQALAMLRRMRSRRVIVVCGRGNNGGDGLVAARLLHNTGASVVIVLASPARAFAGDAAVHVGVARRMGLPMASGTRGAAMIRAVRSRRPTLIIDALFGTGLDRPIIGRAAGLIAGMNDARTTGGACVLAVDLPTGLDADTGQGWGTPGAPCVRADATVTLVALKPGLHTALGRARAGRIVVADIGVPAALLRQAGKDGQGRPRRGTV